MIGTLFHFILNSNKTYSLLSDQYFQAIKACNRKVMLCESVRWHNDGSSGYTLGGVTNIDMIYNSEITAT